MAWNDTTPCPFCGKELSIFRRVAGQYCSKEHQDAFLKQQNQMAVEMLHRTHDALKAYKPTSSSIEDILGAPVARPPAAPPPPPKIREPLPAPAPQAFVQASSREFDKAAAAVLPRMAEPVGIETFHFGDSLGKLQESGFIASLRRLWESLTARRA